ncbi:YdcF family protein [Aquisalimonas asiatica]|uniref:Uncharacterized SAM-binding protein YcdF, DUF218 family n=1 Tax=Aquisalimonas asiatica TaxID=406100 RepID=A0A1H8U578_9GAMM|nr:YdcF family protein [Aquisalimonas asiatica]SEO98216.1 Uncharacterized SAM-binding protein YcdF, DUF218 family [Aquisalimonas asiatica]
MWWSFLERLIFPPTGPILLGLFGLLLWHRRRGRVLVALALVVLYALSTPLGSSLLVAPLERAEPLDLDGADAPRSGVIVVLAGGQIPRAPEYQGDTINLWSLERARYAARVHRALGLPLLVTGGPGEAEALAGVLQDEFGVPVEWVDNTSRNTQENAFRTVELLADELPTEIVLVTKALHLPRATAAFQRAGVEGVTRAPTGYFHRPDPGRRFDGWDLVPDIHGMTRSYMALHEYVGRVWYWIRY